MCNGENACGFPALGKPQRVGSRVRGDIQDNRFLALLGMTTALGEADEAVSVFYAAGWMKRMMKKAKPATKAAAGMVKIQAQTMRVATPHRTAERR